MALRVLGQSTAALSGRRQLARLPVRLRRTAATLEGVTSPEISPRDLRVSDAEREHAITLLEKATGRGLIDISEFTDRTAKVIAAKTRADLNRLLIDLPGLQLSGRPFEPAPPANWHERPPHGEVLELRGYGSRQFTGNWVVPAHIVVTGAGAGTTLDFTQATLTSQTVTIEFRSNLGGGAIFRVPLGTVIRYDGLDMRGCALHNKLPSSNVRAPLVLNLVGTKRYGSITIRGPKKNLKQVIGDLVG